MSGPMVQFTERIQSWLPKLLPWLPICLAWYEMLTTQLAQAAGSGG